MYRKYNCDRVWIFSLHQKYPSHCILLTMYGVHKKPWVREVFLCSPYFSRVCNLNFSYTHRWLPYWVPILMYGEHKKCFTTPWKIGVFLFDSSVSIVGSFWAYYEMFSGHYCSLLLLREKHFFFCRLSDFFMIAVLLLGMQCEFFSWDNYSILLNFTAFLIISTFIFYCEVGTSLEKENNAKIYVH